MPGSAGGAPARRARPPGRRGEIFRFGLLMTALAAVVVLAVALPYWALIGEPLIRWREALER